MVTTQQATDLNTAMKVAEHLLFPSKGNKSIPIALVGQSGIGKTAALTGSCRQTGAHRLDQL